MKPHIVFLTSHPMSVVSFMLPHIRALMDVANVQVLANTSDSTMLKNWGIDVPIEYVAVVRPIAPWADIAALWALYWRLKRIRPSAIHTITPKAGLLGMTAAWLARVPVRVHSFTGQVWVTRAGPMRWLLKAIDKCIVAMATDVLVDSSSQREFLIQQGVVTNTRSAVLGPGSICGVDTQRFCPSDSVRQIVRREMKTSTDALVCLYLGRLNGDKGVLDLAVAFASVATKYPRVELWVVGPDEGNWFVQMQALLVNVLMQVKRVGFTAEPERFMQAADLFCLPSYREGFGSSVIEAAACGLPALASRIYGLTDAVAEGRTGWMHVAGETKDLAKRLDYVLSNPEELVSKGQAAREYATRVYSEDKLTKAMVDFYSKRLNETTL
jgi:glycosyltransferase involved in cell wall biosynthesis